MWKSFRNCDFLCKGKVLFFVLLLLWNFRIGKIKLYYINIYKNYYRIFISVVFGDEYIYVFLVKFFCVYF